MTISAPASAGALPAPADVMVKSQRENFTVASAILGRGRQRHLMAIYGFARLVDDVGDEAAGDRSALLDRIEAELDQIFAGERPEHPIMTTLAHTIWMCGLPDSPFRRLIEANRVDQVVSRYETFDELLTYCQLSAAPVGELVLAVFDAATPERIALSDRICAGLQVTEHLQDVSEDYGRGRIYVPRVDLERFGCAEEDLAGPPTAARRALIAFEAQRAHRLLTEGAPLTRTLPLRPRVAVAGFVAGGRAALNRLGAPEPGAPRRPGFATAFVKAVMGR